ncbi:MAG: hypothetical protein GWN62_20590 [Aliifodinibius sp.]|nr:hypothetical protein [Fodinibius sp.]
MALVFGTLYVAVAGNGDKEEKKTEPRVITMTDLLKFKPEQITIESGQAVLWKNTSVLVHTVTCDSELVARAKNVAYPENAEPFDSGDIEPDSTFQHTFTVPGPYKYFCIPHEATGMVGEIIVKPGDLSSGQ